MKKVVLVVLSILALVGIIAIPANAATSQDVTVTATPAFIGISNSPSTWTVNGITSSGKIAPSGTYYSNPGGDAVAPSATVVDGECRFTITNTSSIAIDLTVTFPNHAGGDASTNGNTGAAGATSFGAYSYFSGVLLASKVIAKSAGSSVGYSNLAASTGIKWGLEYLSQTNAWTSGTSMTSTVTIAATAH